MTAYDQAMQGKDSPGIVCINCKICARTFVFTKDGTNDACEHLVAALEAYVPKKAANA